MTTARELILADVRLCDEDRFFAIELFWYHKEFLLGLIFLLLTTDEGHVFQPTAFLMVFLVFTSQFVNVFLTQ